MKEDNKLHRELKFKDFKESFSFMNQVALLADEMDRKIIFIIFC